MEYKLLYALRSGKNIKLIYYTLIPQHYYKIFFLST